MTPPEAAPDVFALYGTESGNAKIIAFEAVKTFAAAGLTARALGLDELAPAELAKVGHAVFIVSTSGEGDMPYNAVDFWDALKAEDFSRLDRLHYGMIALGDSIYDQFCGAGIMMDDRLHDLGATRLADRIDCDYDFEVLAAQWLEAALPSFAASIADTEGAEGDAVVFSEATAQGRPKFDARIADKRVLTRYDADREVMHYALQVDADDAGNAPFDWRPGDSLNLFFGNDPVLVDAILDRLGLAHDAVTEGTDVPLGMRIAREFELRAVSRDLIKAVAAQASDTALDEMLAAPQAMFERWRETNDLLQLLLDHPGSRFDAETLVGLLRPLQPRAYSIASSPMVDSTSIHLSVRTVAYEHGAREHRGVVSGGLSRRAQIGDLVAVQHVATPSFRLPDDPSADIVMVGAGVGVAPFRSFLQHRAERGDTGRNWLFHGIRNPDEDELYAREFAAWRDCGRLQTYDLCASRIAEGRAYVQDRMRERGLALFEYLDGGAYLYVCGDAEHMAQGVRAALRDIAAQALGSPKDGEFFVEKLQADRRYRQDVY